VGLDREVRRVTAERVVAVDWSGDRSAAGQRRKIWAGVWTKSSTGKVNGGCVTLEGGRTRAEVGEWLIERSRETPRMVVGLDFCFSFPAWFVRECGVETAIEFWELVTSGHGEEWLARGNPDRRFWGKHPKPAEFCGDGLHRMLRATDIDCKLAALIPESERAARVRGIGPKSVFQIGGAGSVGTASLRGMTVLRRLREAGFAVWPFDTARLPMVVEMYTRLNTGPVRKSNADARAEYLRAKRREDVAYAALSRGVIAKARACEDAFDALVSCMAMTARRGEFAGLATPMDPEHKVEGWTWAPDVVRGLIE
jgi:hypothetical protein